MQEDNTQGVGQNVPPLTAVTPQPVASVPPTPALQQEPVDPTPPAPDTPKKHKKLIFLIAGLVVALLLAGGAFVFYGMMSGNMPPQEGTPSPSPASEPQDQPDTSRWETYFGNGYSFKYPKDFNSPETYTEGEYEGVSLLMLGEDQKNSGRTQTELFDGVAIKTLVLVGSEYSTSLDAAIDSREKNIASQEDLGRGATSDIMQQQIGGKEVYYYKTEGFGDAFVYFVGLENSILRVTVMYAGAEDKIGEYLALADQILSTFEFVESDIKSERSEIEVAAKAAYVKKIGEAPKTLYGLAEEPFVMSDSWAFGFVAVEPMQEGSGPGGNFFLAKLDDGKWEVAFEYTDKFVEWLDEVPDEVVSVDQKAQW